MMDAEGCYELNVVVCSTRFEAMSGYHYGCREILRIQRLYCVLHASRRYQGTIMNGEGRYELNVCIVFCTHRGDIKDAEGC